MLQCFVPTWTKWLTLFTQPWEGDITFTLPSSLWNIRKTVVNPTVEDLQAAVRVSLFRARLFCCSYKLVSVDRAEHLLWFCPQNSYNCSVPCTIMLEHFQLRARGAVMAPNFV